jgi:hypothetical protein
MLCSAFAHQEGHAERVVQRSVGNGASPSQHGHLLVGTYRR